MPFPLYALDYGSLCRLRALVSPSEAYELQIAAPHLDGFNPVQKITPFSNYLTISIDYNKKLLAKFQWSSSNVPLNNDKLYSVDMPVTILAFKPDHNARMIFDQFIVASKSMRFYYCHLTTKFLQDISSHLKVELTELFLCNNEFHDDVTLEFICTLFKSLKALIFTGYVLNSNWVDSLITLNYADMQQLEFSYVSIDVLNIDEAQLIKFFNAQGKRFFIEIRLSNTCNASEVSQKLDALFSERYWRVKEGHKRIIRIRWMNGDLVESRCYQLRYDRRQKCNLI